MSILAVRDEFATRTDAPLRTVPALLVVGAVCFNAVLAIINAHVAPLSPVQVIGCELLLVAAAHLVALGNYRPEMLPWYVLAGILVLIACWRAVVLQQIEPRYLRDVLIIPTFVVLGMTFDPRRLTRLVVAVHVIVLAGLLLEAIDTARF